MEGFSPGEPGRAGSGLAAGRRDPPEEGELVRASRTAGFCFLLHVLDGGEADVICKIKRPSSSGLFA
jgi:hypothetical protein